MQVTQCQAVLLTNITDEEIVSRTKEETINL